MSQGVKWKPRVVINKKPINACHAKPENIKSVIPLHEDICMIDMIIEWLVVKYPP